jgi:hypothetical protein
MKMGGEKGAGNVDGATTINPAALFQMGHFYAHAMYEARNVVFHRGPNGVRIFFSSTKGVEMGRLEDGGFRSSGPARTGWHNVDEGTAFRINGNVYAF